MGADTSNPVKGILLKVSSVVVFLIMSTCIKLAGVGLAAGQITFYRSAFAIIPIAIYLACRGELRSGFHTRNPVGHLKRGAIGILAMGLGFYGLVHLPLPDAIAIGYAMPLFAVAFAAIFLGEKVRLYRWTAVLVGLCGVMIISWPKLTMFSETGLQSGVALGAAAVVLSAACGALAMIQVRKLVQEEKTPTIVLYFAITASVFSLATLPFGWDWLELKPTLLLSVAGFCGGIAQILLTESYRHAEVSTIAPFEYTSILLGIIVAYYLFDDIPTWSMLVGTAIVVGAGIYIIYREHRLGLERRAARRADSPRG